MKTFEGKGNFSYDVQLKKVHQKGELEHANGRTAQKVEIVPDV